MHTRAHMHTRTRVYSSEMREKEVNAQEKSAQGVRVMNSENRRAAANSARR